MGPDLEQDNVTPAGLRQDRVDAGGDVLGMKHFLLLDLLPLLLGRTPGHVRAGTGLDQADADAFLVHLLAERRCEAMNGGLVAR
jgi:hypothetical protein